MPTQTDKRVLSIVIDNEYEQCYSPRLCVWACVCAFSPSPSPSPSLTAAAAFSLILHPISISIFIAAPISSDKMPALWHSTRYMVMICDPATVAADEPIPSPIPDPPLASPRHQQRRLQRQRLLRRPHDAAADAACAHERVPPVASDDATHGQQRRVPRSRVNHSQSHPWNVDADPAAHHQLPLPLPLAV